MIWVKRPRDALQASRLEVGVPVDKVGARLQTAAKMERCHKEGVYVQGRWVPITKGGFKRLRDPHDEGIFIGRWELWQKMEKKLGGNPD